MTYMRTVRSLLLDESGTETVEWGLMAGMLISGLVLVLIAVGAWVQTQFETLQSDLGA